MNYKESITALLEGLKGIFENKTATEASAIAQAATKPSTIFYTSDTHAIVVGGHVYGRSNQVSADAPFAYLPADVSSPSADSQFDGNHDTIYIQPIKTGADAGKIKLWWYVNNTWVSTDTLDLVLPTEASDITYDLTNTPDLGSGDVQSAVEALDGKVEDLRDEVFGDEWENIPYGARRMELLDKYQLRTDSNGDLASVSNNICYFYELEGGEEINIQNDGDYGSRFRFYNTFLVSASLNAYVISETEQIAKGTDTTIKVPTNAKMLVVSEPNAGVIHEIVSIRHKGELSIADKTGYKINTWTDDEIITSTTLAVGSIVPYWFDGTRYGCRGVRLNVKEGDKVLLDTYSPALFGLIFTDENRVVKALYDDRRFDGVWTAPVNGYCYIQDVLYRDNFHYASAHGHLAYMAHDARKRVAKGGDWEMQLAPRKFGETFPQTKHLEGADTYNLYWPTASDWVTMGVLNTFTLVATRVKVENCTASDTLSVRARYKNTDSNVIVGSSSNNKEQLESGYQWFYRIYRNDVNRTDCALRLYVSGAGTSSSFDLVVDKMFLHSSSDFAELYALAQKIISGEVEVDNFYGVREKEVDFVKNAIGLQSISDLGYNILDHGATLPIDEDGYKYAKEIYDRYKDNPISSWEGLFKNDEKLVYLPVLHFSNAVTSNLNQQFSGCHNLICVPPMKIPETTANSKAMYSLFDACSCLKRFDWDLSEFEPKVLTAPFRNCHSLEYIGELPDSITKYSTQWTSGCESLEKIERLPMVNIHVMSDFAFFLTPNLRYVKMIDFGRFSAESSFNCSYYWANWGIPNDKHPDARQSLVDSLLTYSYDRVNDPDNLGTAGTTCTITLSANSYAQLTTSEIEAITAKGYTLTHP